MEAKQKLQALFRARQAQKQASGAESASRSQLGRARSGQEPPEAPLVRAALPAAAPPPPPAPAPVPTAPLSEEPPAKRQALPRGFFDDAKADAKAHGVTATDPLAALKAFDQSIASDLAALEESQLVAEDAAAELKEEELAHEHAEHLARVETFKALAARRRAERPASGAAQDARAEASEESEEEDEEALTDWRRRRV